MEIIYRKEEVYKLENGLEIHYFPYPDYHTNYMGFVIPFGANMSDYLIDGKRVKTGIAHFLEHRMFSSEDGDFSEEFARIGAYSNAFTYVDRTSYFFSTNYDAMEAFKLLFKLVTEFHSTEEKVINERNIILREKGDSESNPSQSLNLLLNEKLNDLPSLKYPIIGTKNDIESTTKEDLLLAYETFYRMSNMLLIIAGNVDINEIISYINENYKEPKFFHKLERIPYEEDYNKSFKRVIKIKKDVAENIQTLSIKADLKEFKQKYSDAIYDKIANVTLSLLFDIGSGFNDIFNELDVGQNSLSFSGFELDDICSLSFRYLGKTNNKPNKYILDALENPEKYINTRDIELFEKYNLGRKFKMLQNMSYVHYEALINLERDHDMFESIKEDFEVTIKEIKEFANVLRNGVIIKGEVIPK